MARSSAVKSFAPVWDFSLFTTVRPISLALFSTKSAPPVPNASESCKSPILVNLVSSLMNFTMAPAAMESSGRTRNIHGFPCLVRLTFVAPINVGTP